MEYVWNPLSILAHLKVQQVAIVGNLPLEKRMPSLLATPPRQQRDR